MDWVSTWEYLSGQGAMFWSATVAVALGVTLILTAGHLQWRRLGTRSTAPVFAVRATKPATLSDPSLAADVLEKETPTEYFPQPSPAAFQTLDRQEMGVLVARLRSAADRLAAFQESRPPIASVVVDSQLKVDRNPVEYLFRAGKG